MNKNEHFNCNIFKICILCATENSDGYELHTKGSKNMELMVKTILGCIGRANDADKLYSKWLCKGCHLAGTATVEFFSLVASGQQKLVDIKLESQKKTYKPLIHDENILKIENNVKTYLKKRPGQKKVQGNIATTVACKDPLDNSLLTTFHKNKRQRRPPKRFRDEVIGKLMQQKKIHPIIITPPAKEIDSCTLITSQSIAEFRSEAGYALGEIIEVQPDTNITEDAKKQSFDNTKTYFICEYCKAAFAKRCDFLHHIMTHENCIYECSVCSKNFQNKLSFNEHQAETGHAGCGIIEFSATTEGSGENISSAVGNINIEQIIGKETSKKNECSNYPEGNEKSTNPNRSLVKLSNSIKNEAQKFNNSKFACVHCSKSFGNHYAVKRHYQLVHVAKRAFKCSFCSASFKTNYSLNVHQATHTGERRYCCNFCDKAFITKYAREIHTRTHTGEKPYICKDCSKSFAHCGNLMMHKRVHTKERPYKCPTCELTFKSLSNLKKHKTLHLRKITENNKTELLNAKKLNQTLPLTNIDVNIERATRPEIRSVEILPPYNNLISHSTNFGNSDAHAINIATTHDTTNSVTTTTSAAIELKSVYSFSCSVCLKRFTNCSALKKHQRTHTGERPYKCHMCPRAFADPSNFKKHKMLHKNATYELKIESEKQRLNATRQIFEDQSSLDVTTAISLDPFSPSSIASDPDPDGLEVLQRLDKRRQSFKSSANNDSDHETNQESGYMLTKEHFFNFNYSLVQPNVIRVFSEIEGNQNKLLSSNNATEMPSTPVSLTSENTQIICISYQDPMNPVDKQTTTFYALN